MSNETGAGQSGKEGSSVILGIIKAVASSLIAKVIVEWLNVHKI